MAHGTLERLVPSTAAALGMARAGVSGVFLISVLVTPFSDLGRLPVTILRPLGVMRLFSWDFYDRLLTPEGMIALKCALSLSLLFSTLGYLTRWTTKSSALLIIFYQGLTRSFAHFNHDEMLGVYLLVVLAFTPCGDAFSLDSWGKRPPRRPRFAYGYPILLMRLLLAWVYFSAGVIKLRISGLNYFNPDSLPALAIFNSLGNLHDTQFRYAFWLPQVRDYLPPLMVMVVLWEILFPLAVFSRRARLLSLGFGAVFHFSTALLMNIFFPHLLAMYLIFVDWPAVAGRFEQLRPFRRAVGWWRDFRAAPETFPDVRLSKLIPKQVGAGGLLLWDGDCGFCAASLRWLRRVARRPFADEPYQLVEERLPDDVRRWTERQMYWIDRRGRVTGGSQALIEMLASTGHPHMAVLLESRILRPFVWLGYRLVARHRRAAARASGQSSCAV
jgi:predicted DCC family thiol-disulfide oxidoreductase YuxK